MRRIARFVREWIHGITHRPLEFLPESPDLFRGYRYFAAHFDLKRVRGGWIYQGGYYPDHLTVGGAGCAIHRVAARFCTGNVADIGAGDWPLPGAIPVDLEKGPGAGKRIEGFPDASLDAIFSSHCLEHIDDWKEALRLWLRKVRVGGVLFLYLPHPDCAIWNPGSPFVGDGHRWVPTPPLVADALTGMGCRIRARDDGPDGMYSFYLCAEKGSEGEG